MACKVASLLVTVIFVGCCAVPIARQRRQIEPYVIERIDNRELNYESDKFMKPIEELPNRDREIRSDSEVTKHSVPEPEDSEQVISQESVYAKYPASVEDLDSDFTTEPNPSSQEEFEEYEKPARARQEQSQPTRVNVGFEGPSVVDESNAEQLFLESINDKIQEQYADKVDETRHRLEDGAQEEDKFEVVRRKSSTKKEASDAAETQDSTKPSRASEVEMDKRARVTNAEPASAAEQIDAMGEKPRPGEAEEEPAVLVVGVKANPTEATAVDKAKPSPPESSRLASEAKQEAAEESPEPEEVAKAAGPRSPPRKPASRSHSMLRSSSEEITSLLEDRDGEMEKDLISQSQSEKSSSIVQRSPSEESGENKEKNEEKKEKSEEAKEEEARAEVGDIIMNFYPTEENITYMRNTLSSMLDSVMNFVAISNAVAAMNNVQPLINIISRFSPNN